MNKLVVKKVAVLGAGVMGAQIAAHFANCNHQVYLFDLPQLAEKALLTLKKLKPRPIVSSNVLEYIIPCDYDTNLKLLSNCDWVIEAVAEDINIKQDLFSKIEKYIKADAVITSNTSGLSINNLSELLAKNNLNKRFCGVHFFNPPRYQKLVEIIPHNQSDDELLNQLEEYVVQYLGKGVIRAKDTPNFIANRIGVFSMLATIHHATNYKIDYDIVDSLTGELIGRPKSATFRTADVVGLDTLAKVIDTMYQKCPDDPWHDYLAIPNAIQELINKGFLGQKTQKGFYTKDKSGISIIDLNNSEYNPIDSTKVDKKLIEILKIKDVNQKFTSLREYQHPQAKFLWACFRDIFHYSAYHLCAIANNVSDVDNTLKWGFGWQQGPFEIWQDIGWKDVTQWIDEDIKKHDALSNQALPNWVYNIEYTYNNNKSYNPVVNKFEQGSKLKVYNRQYTIFNKNENYNNILENNSAKLWAYEDNLIFSFKTKANTINTELLDLLNESIDYIESHERYNSLIIWQDSGRNFSAGADISGFLECIQANDFNKMDQVLQLFQNTCQRIRYSNFPVIAAVQGLALGGGCELVLHCDRVISAIESYIGLVEVGVGVIPAGGGCKEMVRRAHLVYQNIINNKLDTSSDKLVQYYFANIATATVSSSAQDALEKGYLDKLDLIMSNSDELLKAAIKTANQLVYCNYQPPVNLKFKAGGERLKANLLAVLANYKVGEFISEHDYLVLSNLAHVLSGGGVSSDTEITENWLLTLERKCFIELLKTDKTRERINYMLAKNKPLRN